MHRSIYIHSTDKRVGLWDADTAVSSNSFSTLFPQRSQLSESLSYAVREDGGVVEVCAVLDQNPDDGCLADFSFNISISTIDGRAGN